jgi:hypothetical protein
VPAQPRYAFAYECNSLLNGERNNMTTKMIIEKLENIKWRLEINESHPYRYKESINEVKNLIDELKSKKISVQKLHE